MNERPQILDGLNVRDGWDRREQSDGPIHLVRIEENPITGIITEWKKPIGKGGFFKRTDTTPGPQATARIVSTGNKFWEGTVYDVSTDRDSITNKLRITSFPGGVERAMVEFTPNLDGGGCIANSI